jgi:hypothetical protein
MHASACSLVSFTTIVPFVSAPALSQQSPAAADFSLMGLHVSSIVFCSTFGISSISFPIAVSQSFCCAPLIALAQQPAHGPGRLSHEKALTTAGSKAVDECADGHNIGITQLNFRIVL